MPDTPSPIEEASAWSMAWVVAIAVGAAIALRLRRKHLDPTAPAEESFGDLLLLYVVWSGVVFVGEPAMPDNLRQVMVAVATLRWATLFALLAHALRTRRHLSLAAAVFLIEFALGFLSFFSAFRIPLFVLALALPEGNLRLRARHYFGGAVVGAAAITLAIGWSAIKGDYRYDISKGSGWQAVSVSLEDQVSILFDRVGALDGDAMADGTVSLVTRIAYTDYFASVIAFVPRGHPYEEGRLWLGAITHVLLPRAFFPDKPIIETDTRRAWRYTGLHLLRFRGTSIALGAPAETYVDFGVPMMLLPALLFGLLVGFMYAWPISHSGSLFDRGLSVALVLPLATLENGPTKLLGSTLSLLVIAWLVRPLVKRWITRERPTSPAQAPVRGLLPLRRP